ncbi:unnamed protein product [Paramecium sonneborni]|uniref:Protein kinase domain-containing protein n=1 Tax=Paramecium sonneborni TaxID=65129 RepID=A0A8S1P613_9CILI|nr:unnamed protein product [Paramecium sonneborni]
MIDDIKQELIRLIQYMQFEGFSHQNIKLENIYYYSLMNQITVVNFGKSVFRNQPITPSDSYFSKTTKDYSDLYTNSCRNTYPDKDIFDCGLVFFQLVTQKIQDCKQIHYQNDYKTIMSLITEIHNQKISAFLIKLLLQNKALDKPNFSENLLQEIDLLNLELHNYRNN